MWLAIVLIGFACSGTRAVWHDGFGPWVNATKGELFPQAKIRSARDDFLVVRPSTFQFKTAGHTCDILEEAMTRYKAIIMKDARIAWKAASPVPKSYVYQNPFMRGDMIDLTIQLRNPCERLPYLNMNENYTLTISEQTKNGILVADDIWGILRGLESFSQLVAASSDGHLTIKCQDIEDSPKFPHRGLLLDTSRHYIPVQDILLTLDAMSYNKLNVFHWHIIDDNSFPYVSTAFPELSSKGAYHSTMVYTPENVRKIVEYARLRGIRVIAEFDTPAHTKAVGQSHPELLTECWEAGQPSGKLGPFDPSKPEVWAFLRTLFDEVLHIFPDRFVHLGGDEILFDCWKTNPAITDYMKKRGIKDGDYGGLEGDYFEKLLELIKAANARSIVWQEVFSNVRDLSPDTTVQIWTGAWEEMLVDVVDKNHTAILSACWYLDALKSGGDWEKYYHCDPWAFESPDEKKAQVLGGEACMWSEFVDRTNVHSRIWPRASAAAERLWYHSKDTIEGASKRLEEHACRMMRRGIPAQPPNGSGFCVT